jgi:tetratricopeptide (TPR) repeat protein
MPVKQQDISLTERRQRQTIVLAGIVGAFLLTVMCYWPSLGGPFVFDDIPNLELLGKGDGLTSPDKYIEFVFSARSSTLGRPLSLMSFTLDGQNWPTDPRPFRITNLLLHLANGLLVFFLTRAIFSTSQKPGASARLALLCMTLWLLHPLLVSTTAYIVQRMTQLSTLFTLAGLLCYMHGRRHLVVEARKGWYWVIGGMGFFGTLALLSKETGILLPGLALVLEVTVFGSDNLARRTRRIMLTLFWLPLIALVAYFAINWQSLAASFDYRPFSLPERLMTQAVALVDYLLQTIVPRLSGLGIFHDDYPISRSLLSPAATLASVAVIVALIVFAVRARKKWPFISLGILWFFVGHSLEAGPLALELYFEHRNYLPLLGPLIAIVSLLPALSRRFLRLVPVVIVLVIIMESFITWQAAVPWGNEDRLMQTALIEHPGSLRAQQYVANRYIIHGMYQEALETQNAIAEKYPQHASTRLSILNLRCLLGVLSTEQVQATIQFIKHADYDSQIAQFLRPLVSNVTAGSCDALDSRKLQTIFDAFLLSPNMGQNSVLRGAVNYHKGILYKESGNLNAAMKSLDSSYEAGPNIDIRLQQVVWLLASGRIDEAQHYLDLARQHEYGFFAISNLRDADLNSLQQQIDRARRGTS